MLAYDYTYRMLLKTGGVIICSEDNNPDIINICEKYAKYAGSWDTAQFLDTCGHVFIVPLNMIAYIVKFNELEVRKDYAKLIQSRVDQQQQGGAHESYRSATNNTGWCA